MLVSYKRLKLVEGSRYVECRRPATQRLESVSDTRRDPTHLPDVACRNKLLLFREITFKATGSTIHSGKSLYEISIYGSTVLLLELGRNVSFLIYTQSVGLLGREISPSQGRYLHTEHHKHNINAHKHPCLVWDWNPRSQCSRERRQFMS
jgi:hypothetical protein